MTFDDLDPARFDEASIKEIEAGRLPLRVQRRLAATRTDQAFTSNVTVDEFHAIRSVGFSVAGQVLGSCVYHEGHVRRLDCGYNTTFYERQLEQQARIRTRDEYYKGLVPVSAPSVIGSSTVRPVDRLLQARYDARMLAISRMRQECMGLGGDGVVAVTLTATPFPAGGVEFRATGTAVRADGPVRPREPFLSDLTGQDFAKLMTAGWVPCGFVLGLGVMIRHDDFRTNVQRRSWRNVEVTGRTQLVSAARKVARKRLRADCARHGGEGVVVRTSSLRIWSRKCRTSLEGHDHLAEALVTGCPWP